MKPTDLLQRLLDVYAAKAVLRRRHVAVACVAAQYDVNNTYQYVIAREDQHLAWLADAIRGMGGQVPAELAPETLAPVKGDEAMQRLAAEDARGLETFVTDWRPRVASVSNARHKLMLGVMLGESQEHARLFQQASAGQLDMLGRRTGGARLPGGVLPTRWVE